MSENEQTTGLAGQDGQDANPSQEGQSEQEAEGFEGQSEKGGQEANPIQEGQSEQGEDSGENNEYYGAPETYDFKDMELPEGFQIDTALAEKFAPIGKELNLSQQGANKLANLLVEIQQEQLAGANEKIAEYKKQEKEATRLSYEKLLNTDKEIGGGDKAKMNGYLDVADVGYGAFASDELKAILSELHLDYHPAVIKHFHRLGKLCGNDRITKTNAPTGLKQDAAEILYGNKSE